VSGLVIGIISAVFGAIATLTANRLSERRPKLSVYYGHISGFTVRPVDGDSYSVNTHSVVLRNTGTRPAENVAMTHKFLPINFSVWPVVKFEVVHHGGDAADIVFPRLVPEEQITVSYLYFPPITVAQVNGPTKFDGGYAKVVEMELQQQYSRRLQLFLGMAALSGFGAWLYLVIRVALFLRARFLV
jgi:hypothetical protein